MVQSYQSKIKIAVVGAGPSGVYCAVNILGMLSEIKFANFELDLFDKGQVLRTILPTGNGRCNITNAIDDIKEFAKNYPRGEKFLYSLFSRHSNFDSIDFFKSIGIDTVCESDGRIFPKSQSAKDVRNKLFSKLKSFKNVNLINKKISSKNELKNYDIVVICTGSRGSETLIKSFGHNCIEFKKALCALKIENASLYPKGVSVKSLDGDFIFTKDGISGPLVFKISSINAYKEIPYNIAINLFDSEELIKACKEFPKKSILNLLSNFIPKSLALVLIGDENKKAAEVSNKKLISYSKLNLKIISTASMGEIVNAGGVDLNELDKDCKSKIQDNLWFCGEVMNIDGFCGGFNLQNCWSSGYVVAKSVVSFIIKKYGLEL